MPFQPELDTTVHVPALPAAALAAGWRRGLPTLRGSLVTLRELRLSDAEGMLAAMSTEDVARFLSPPPTTTDGFEKFIAWAHRERAVGRYISFAVAARGDDRPIGLFQIRSLEPDFGCAEWGFALAVEYWGTGLFVDAARLAIDFAFDVLGTHRLEARAALSNGRGNGALRKLGATQEGVLRRSLLRNGEFLDQALWTIVADEWLRTRTGDASRIVH
ncbi:MAG TPA: GNAT family N-acetyltransferase [Vicinamibacterales bacterium]